MRPASGTLVQPASAGTLVQPGIALDRRGGDAWVWRKRLGGSCPGCPPEATIVLRVNGRDVPAAREGDRFAAEVPLDPGANEVVAVATRPDGTVAMSAPVAYHVRLDPRPTARLAARVEGERIVFDGTGSRPSEYDAAPVRTWRVVPRAGNPAPLDLAEAAPGVFAGPVPAGDGEYVATLAVADERGRSDRAAARIVVERGRARVPDPLRERAAWIDDAVVYGVVPRAGEPPGLAGVAARLDDLADLGVSALWLAPIARSVPGDYGYAVTDYFDLRPDCGTVEDLRALVAAAHARGLRVLLDVVPNHTSVEHLYAKDAAAHGPVSAYWDFYDRDAGGTPTHYFDWSHLPNLNYDNPEVRRFVLEALAFWLRECDVDGFRVDAVWGIKERYPTWIDDLLAEVRRIKPDGLVIAEASARDPFYAERGFDAAYDWTGELGRWAWGGVFGGDGPTGGEGPIGAAMVAALTDGGREGRPSDRVLRFLNNNDTGRRFVTTHGVGCYRVALAMLLTLPGLPCLFDGDEVGAEYEPYRASGPIDRTDRHALRGYVKRLIALRRAVPSLRSPDWRPLAVEPAAPLFVYLRGAAGAAPTLVVLNFSPDALTATLSPPAGFRSPDGSVVDLWSGDSIPVGDGALAVPVPGWGVRLLAGREG